MVIKTKELVFDDVKLTVKQISFASQIRLDQMGKNKTFQDIYKECLDDPSLLEKLTVVEGVEVSKAINEINGWEIKKIENKEDVEAEVKKKENGT